MQRGKLITFEGGEGAGKTTQTSFLKVYLEKKGYQVVMAREPGGTTIGEQIRQVVLSAKNVKMSELAEVFLYQAARAQVYEEIIKPALERGAIVLMDRSRDSSVVYQGIVRGIGIELIESLNEISMAQTKPDLTMLLDLPSNVGFERKIEAEFDRLELAGKTFHEQVREGYLQLYKNDTNKRWVKIDATQSIIQVRKEVERCVNAKLT